MWLALTVFYHLCLVQSQQNAVLTGSSRPQLIPGRNRFDTDSSSLSFHWRRWSQPSGWAPHTTPAHLCHPLGPSWAQVHVSGGCSLLRPHPPPPPQQSRPRLSHPFQNGSGIERSSPSRKPQATPSAGPCTLEHRHTRVLMVTCTHTLVLPEALAEHAGCSPRREDSSSV